MASLENRLGLIVVPLILAALSFLPGRARAQSPLLPSELRGVIDTLSFSVDSVFVYNKKNDLFLAGSRVPYADTVTVPNKYRLQIPTDDPLTPKIEGASLGDTLYFTAKSDRGILKVLSQDESVIHEPGEIKEVNLRVVVPDNVEEIETLNLPLYFALHQNYPNPFNLSTRVVFQLKRRGYVNLEVYNVVGRRVRTLHKGSLGAGSYETIFNAMGLASGVYFLRMRAGQEEASKKAVLVK